MMGSMVATRADFSRRTLDTFFIGTYSIGSTKQDLLTNEPYNEIAAGTNMDGMEIQLYEARNAIEKCLKVRAFNMGFVASSELTKGV